MFEIKRYAPTDKERWNSFVKEAKNATFLLDRAYMDYHQDRFADASLLFYKEGRLYALLPAHIANDTLYTHLGLTYGGLVMDYRVTASDTLCLFEELNTYLRTQHFKRVVYRPTPSVYHLTPAEEDLYALFKVCNAQLVARSISSVIDLTHPLKWSENRIRGVKRCLKNGIEIKQSTDFAAFWQVLGDNLMNKYGAKPVHSLQEIELLHQRFPHHILLYVACKDDMVLGGTVLYLTPNVVHTQYISASPEGKQLRVIDGLFHFLLHQSWDEQQYFDFGTSTLQDGHLLNASLIHQKEGFGGRAICYDTYQWEV